MRFLLDRDLIGGAFLVLAGLLASYVAVTYYPLGTPQRMGPGMFPAGLGILLATLGCLQIILTWNKPKTAPVARVYSPLFVLGSVASFASVISVFGLIPAIVCVVVVSSAAELRVRFFDTVLLICGLSLITPFIFGFCLGLPITLFEWPF
jgi:hypothetical protein